MATSTSQKFESSLVERDKRNNKMDPNDPQTIQLLLLAHKCKCCPRHQERENPPYQISKYLHPAQRDCVCDCRHFIRMCK